MKWNASAQHVQRLFPFQEGPLDGGDVVAAIAVTKEGGKALDAGEPGHTLQELARRVCRAARCCRPAEEQQSRLLVGLGR